MARLPGSLSLAGAPPKLRLGPFLRKRCASQQGQKKPWRCGRGCGKLGAARESAKIATPPEPQDPPEPPESQTARFLIDSDADASDDASDNVFPPPWRETMKSSRFSRNPLPLSDTCQRRLNSYALAATAAGVGSLALALPAEAKIVYTPAHRVMSTSDPQHWYPLDLNHDGVKDFSFSAYYEVGMSSQFAFLLLCYASAAGSTTYTKQV